MPPLLGVAAQLGEKAIAVLGFRTKGAVILEEDFQAAGAKAFIATDDGSYGHHGLVTDLCRDQDFDCVMACGPAPMLKAVTALGGAAGRALLCLFGGAHGLRDRCLPGLRVQKQRKGCAQQCA